MDRELIFDALIHLIEARVHEAEKYIEGLIESRDTDTKSSAGDKYETSREMIQQEIDRGEQRLRKLYQERNELISFSTAGPHQRCDPGALIQLDGQYILLGSALGKMEVNGISLLCISMASPIGQLLRGKETGDTINFNKNTREINSIF